MQTVRLNQPVDAEALLLARAYALILSWREPGEMPRADTANAGAVQMSNAQDPDREGEKRDG